MTQPLPPLKNGGKDRGELTWGWGRGIVRKREEERIKDQKMNQYTEIKYHGSYSQIIRKKCFQELLVKAIMTNTVR